MITHQRIEKRKGHSYKRRYWCLIGLIGLSFDGCSGSSADTSGNDMGRRNFPLVPNSLMINDEKPISRHEDQRQGLVVPCSSRKDRSSSSSSDEVLIHHPSHIGLRPKNHHRLTSLDRWVQTRSRQGSITIELGRPPTNERSTPPKEQPTSQIEDRTTTTTTTNTSTPGSSLYDDASMNSNNNSKDDGMKWHTLMRERSQYLLLGRPLSPMMEPFDRHFEVTVSISPTSVWKIIHLLGIVTVGIFGAFGATLRLLAPMIVGRRIINSIGYVCYDYYNGRYLRTTYHKRLKNLEAMEVPSVFRAFGRMGIQLSGMVMVGGMIRIFLSTIPCCILPEVACRYWFGSVWVISVLLAGTLVELWMKKIPGLQLHPVAASATTSMLSLTQPWHILQWMKDPETWLLNLTRLQQQRDTRKRRFNYNNNQNNSNNNNNNGKPLRRRPDPLLFPSTWPPLMILSAIGMVHTIAQTLPLKTGANTRMLVQDFCLAVTILDEWRRLFLYEYRIALGFVWSAMSFAAFFVLCVSTAFEVGWISCGLLLPIVFSCLVSGWMNAVLYSEHYVQNR